MVLQKSDKMVQRDTVFIPSLRSLDSGVEQFPPIGKYLTKPKTLNETDTGQWFSPVYRL